MHKFDVEVFSEGLRTLVLYYDIRYTVISYNEIHSRKKGNISRRVLCKHGGD